LKGVIAKMSKGPSVGKFLDAEEGELFRTIGSGGYKLGESFLTPERKPELQRRRVEP
jgi:hypothetical protein